MAITGRVMGTLPASDMERAKKFYAEKLGLTPSKEVADGAVFECADGTKIMLFPSSGKASGTHTQASFEVDDVRAEVKALKSRGVRFEEYAMPGFESVDSVVSDKEGIEGAWLKDSEGNLIALTNRMPL